MFKTEQYLRINITSGLLLNWSCTMNYLAPHPSIFFFFFLNITTYISMAEETQILNRNTKNTQNIVQKLDTI